MPPAEWFNLRHDDISATDGSLSPAAMQAAIRLLELGIRSDGADPIAQRLAEQLASIVAADRVELVARGE